MVQLESRKCLIAEQQRRKETENRVGKIGERAHWLNEPHI